MGTRDDALVLADAGRVDLGDHQRHVRVHPKADELSMTTAPALAAIGEKRLDTPEPAENSAMSTPSNERSVSSSIRIVCPRKSTVCRPSGRSPAPSASRRESGACPGWR